MHASSILWPLMDVGRLFLGGTPPHSEMLGMGAFWSCGFGFVPCHSKLATQLDSWRWSRIRPSERKFGIATP